MQDLKQKIINDYFSLTGEKLTNDDPIITLILYFQLQANKTLNDSDLNSNLQKTLLEINNAGTSLNEIHKDIEAIQLNRLQIVNEISAMNKAQIYKEFKEAISKELTAKTNNEALTKIDDFAKNQKVINFCILGTLFMLLLMSVFRFFN